MHAVFLYHAIRQGMDMGIVNPSSSVLYEDIEPSFRTVLEDVILYRRPEAADELIAYAQQHTQQTTGETEKNNDEWRHRPVGERLEYALMKGVADFLEDDLAEALTVYPAAVNIIDGPLMSGMNKVGDLFGAGKMFLPQVVKTARTMKKAVTILQPAIEAGKAASETVKKGKIVFATVKGDVHDIGKNIVSIVLTCNNYEVIDLGVMTPAEVILQAVEREKADILCLSGLITPSLDEMVHVTEEMQKAGHTIPILLGGATTSRLHTALKIAPCYTHPVVYAPDASQAPLIASKLLNPNTKDTFICELNEEYERLRQLKTQHTTPLMPLAEARANRLKTDWASYTPVTPAQSGVQQMDIPIKTLIPYIHWTFFFQAWRLNGRYDDLPSLHDCQGCRQGWLARFPADERGKAEEALRLYDDAQQLLHTFVAGNTMSCKALYGFFPSVGDGDDIHIGGTTLPTLRQQAINKENTYLSLADYVMPSSEKRTDYVGAFAVTIDRPNMAQNTEKEDDNYRQLLSQTLTDRLAEAAAEYLHEQVRKTFWGYAAGENLPVPELFKAHYRGIRPAIGYPSLPDQQQIFALNKLLNLSKIGVSITENGAMTPTSTVAGLYLAHPAARYFMIGRISDEQLQDYAVRCGRTTEDVRRFLNKNL